MGLLSFGTFAYGENVNLEVWSFSIRQDGLKAVNEKVIPAYEAAHPGVKVKWIHIPYSEFYDKLVASLAAGIGPDIIMDGNNITGWRIFNDITIPLDNLVRDWDQADDVVALELGKYKGHIGTIPYEIKVAPVAYRADLFSAAGLDADRPPETRKEFLEFGRRLTRIQGDKVVQQGTDFPGRGSTSNYLRMLNVMVQMGGGWLLDENSERAIYNNDLGAESLQWMKDVYETAVAPPGLDSLQGADYREGNVAMIFFNPNLMNYLHGHDGARAETRIGPPLMKEGVGKRVGVGGGNGLSISAHSPHQLEAWDFIKFIMRPQNQLAVHLANGTVPTVRSVYDRPEFSDDPLLAGIVAAGPYLLNHDRGETTPAYRGTAAQIGEPLMRAVMGEIPVKQGLAESAERYQVRINEVLGK